MPASLINVRRVFLVLLALGMVLGACAPAAQPVSEGVSGKLVLYSGRSESLIQPVIDAFTTKYPDVEVSLKSGNNSQMANALLEEKGNPQADMFITTEIFTIQALAQEGIFQPYRPATADKLPAEAQGSDDLWFGLTRRVRVIMYNTELVSPEEAPQSIFDLTDPKWKGQIAATGSTNGGMQAHIAVLEKVIGAEATQEWLNGLKTNEVTFFGSHTDVRKAVGAGEFKIGLVNHYYYYLQAAEGSPVGIVFPDQNANQMGLVSNLTAAGVVSGAKNPAAAQALMDFLLSEEGQKLFSELNYEYPVLPGVAINPAVESMNNYRQADVNLRDATISLDNVFAIIEAVGLP